MITLRTIVISNITFVCKLGLAALIALWANQAALATDEFVKPELIKIGPHSFYSNQSDVGRELQIPVHQWHNPEMEPTGVIVALQGLIFSGKMFSSLAEHLNSLGYYVYANDVRGFGDWRQPDHGFKGDSKVHFGQSKQDLTDILKVLRRKFPDKPIFLVGESFGGNMAVWEAATNPDLMDGVIAAGFGAKTRIHPRPYWVKTFFVGLNNPSKKMDLKPYIKPVLTEDKHLTAQLMQNPETVTSMSTVELIKAAVTNNAALKEMQAIPEDMPILFLAGGKDRVLDTKALPEAIARLGTKKSDLKVFDGKGHMLLECDEVEPEVLETIDAWLEKNQAEFAEKLVARKNACADCDKERLLDLAPDLNLSIK